MRIIFVIKKLENIAGGAEKVLSIISSELANRGHEINVISFDNIGSKPFYKFSTKVKLINIDDKRKKIKNKFLLFVYRILILRKKISLMKPDITVGFMHSIYILLSLAMLGKKINVIASEHIVPEYYESRKLEYLLLNITSFFLKKITVVSKEVKNKFPFLIRKKMVILPNPINNFKVSQGNNLYKSGKQILSVGRLSQQKDQATLIKAFSLLINKFPNWSLKIIGEGPLRSELENLISDLEICDKVSLPGLSKDIHEDYNLADIFVIPSKFESFGIVTAEAMLYSLPVIGFSDCIGTNKLIIDNITGLLVQPSQNKVLSLASAMEKLMKSEKKRLKFGKAGLNRINLYSSNDIIADKWERFLKKNIN